MNMAFAFLRRDALIWSSYRMAAFWQLLGILVFIGLVYFLGSTLDSKASAVVGDPQSFVAFVLSGIAFTDLLMQGLYSLPHAIRDNQKSGTLEPMLLTPISPIGLAFASSLFNFALAGGRLLAYLIFGFVVLGYWHNANPLSLLLVLIPAAISFVALGALSAAFIVLLKQGDPVLVAYGAITALLSGVFFPVDVLPAWVQPLTFIVPLSHALAGIRAALDGAPPAQIIEPALVLLVMALLLLPIGIWTFNWAVNRARRDGTLAQY